MQIVIEISEDTYKKLTQKSMLMSASAIDEAVDAIKNGRVFNDWIDIKKKLPPLGTDFLVCDYSGDIYLTHRVLEGDVFRCRDPYGDKIKDIVAWMPLPEPYKKE